ncbi:hypothetical protein KIPB_014707, partial [Kipferlia bialata]|eukprot:g14707.t1
MRGPAQQVVDLVHTYLLTEISGTHSDRLENTQRPVYYPRWTGAMVIYSGSMSWVYTGVTAVLAGVALYTAMKT